MWRSEVNWSYLLCSFPPHFFYFHIYVFCVYISSSDMCISVGLNSSPHAGRASIFITEPSPRPSSLFIETGSLCEITDVIRLAVRTSPRNSPVFTPSTQFRDNRCVWSCMTFMWVLGYEQSAYVCMPGTLLNEPSPRFKNIMFLKFIFCHMIISIECF